MHPIPIEGVAVGAVRPYLDHDAIDDGMTGAGMAACAERHDLSGKMPQKAQQLREKLHRWRRQVGAQMPKPNPAYTPGAK